MSLSETAIQLINGSTRESTKRKYSSIVGKWRRYCEGNHLDLQATTTTFANFLGQEFDRDLKYSYLRSYTAALASYISAVDYTIHQKLLKGIHNKRPSTPRYSAIWDVNIVLAYIGAMITDSFRDMTLKMAALLMLLSGNRVNMLSHLKVTNMFINDNECTFIFDEVLKTTMPGESTKPMVFRAYPQDSSLCPVKNMWKYLEVRNEKSGNDQLFVITMKPFTAAKSDTIANWLKKVLDLAGINTGRYSAHSYRSSSTSAAAFGGVSIGTILKSASWANVDTFKKHYLRELDDVYNLEGEENFGVELLNQHHSVGRQ